MLAIDTTALVRYVRQSERGLDQARILRNSFFGIATAIAESSRNSFLAIGQRFLFSECSGQFLFSVAVPITF
jgi:hypothetical protein